MDRSLGPLLTLKLTPRIVSVMSTKQKRAAALKDKNRRENAHAAQQRRERWKKTAYLRFSPGYTVKPKQQSLQDLYAPHGLVDTPDTDAK